MAIVANTPKIDSTKAIHTFRCGIHSTVKVVSAPTSAGSTHQPLA